MAYPKHLLWIDIETTGLPEGTDYTDVHLLETGVILTDMALNRIVGLTDVIGLTAAAADAIRKNDYVRKMHGASGLLKESIASKTTMTEAEDEIIAVLKENGVGKGEAMIAGSGVAAFDHPFIKAKMPRLNAYLAYFPYDIGIVRRMTRTMIGKDVVNVPASYGDTKEHRAMNDVLAHLEEATLFQTYLRETAR